VSVDFAEFRPANKYLTRLCVFCTSKLSVWEKLNHVKEQSDGDVAQVETDFSFT